MAFFTVNKDPEAVKDSAGTYINESGMYDVLIKTAFVTVNDNKARSIGLLIDYEDTEQPIFNAFRLDNNDGSPNLGQEMFNKLLIVTGIDELDEPEEGLLPIGKNKTDVEVGVISELEDVPVTLRIAMEYDIYDGDIQERKTIKNVFHPETRATASEIINEIAEPFQYDKELKYADKMILRNGLTEETVENWIANGRRGKTTGKTTSKTSSKPTGKTSSKEAVKNKPKFGRKK